MFTPTVIGQKYRHFGALLLVAVLAPHPAFATLGEPETSVASDAAEFKASVKSMEQANYRVHQIQLPSGTVLREFAAPDGIVFAVAWNGPSMPDLRQTLGAYFNAFAAAAKAPHGGHHMLQVQQDQFVMQSSGHMRAFTGRAYLPQALPAGVAPDELH